MSARATLSLYQDSAGNWGLIEGDALKALAKLPAHSIDCVVTDPPYGIRFHDEAWDGADIHEVVARRGERLSDGEAIERFTTRWAAECRRVLKPGGHMLVFSAPRMFHRLVAGVEEAGLEVRDQLLWLNGQGLPKSRRLPGGLGTTLKPAYEPVLLARAPLQGRLQDNLGVFNTGALNIDAARVPRAATGRGYWPANVVLTHAPGCTDQLCASDCPAERLPETLSRLFYCAKASRQEREAGCEGLPVQSVQIFTGKHHPPRWVRNTHPCVKPVALMRWLVKLVAPPGGLVLDPFAGSGTTGIAAVLEDRMFLGIERQPAYVDVACARITHWARKPRRESA